MLRHASLRFSGRSRSSFGYNYGKPAEIFQRELQQKKNVVRRIHGIAGRERPVALDQQSSGGEDQQSSGGESGTSNNCSEARRLGGSEGRWLDVKEKKRRGGGRKRASRQAGGRLWAATRLCTLSALEFKVSLRPTGKHRCWIVGQHSGWLLLCTYHSSAL